MANTKKRPRLKHKTKILITILFTSTILLTGCNAVLYWFAFKPTDTWYFKVDFDKKTNKTVNNFQISDSVNISKSAIRLVRKKVDSVYCYWIDIDTMSFYDKNQRINTKIKIVGQDGQIKRFLGGWFEADSSNSYDLSKYSIIEKKNGDVVFIIGKDEFNLKHLGDEMGMHHSEIQRPENIPLSASFNAVFEGYDFIYSWIVFKNIENGFLRLYSYDYSGNLKDSTFVNADSIELQENYYFKEGYRSLSLYNNSKKQELFIDAEPFQGYGADSECRLLNADLQCLERGKYIKNIFMTIFDGHGKSFPNYRSAKTLNILNATVKSIGYDKFLSQKEFEEPRLSVSRYGVGFSQEFSISKYVDSLLHYQKTDEGNRYYYEFWERRKSEGTYEIVISILNDINDFYSLGKSDAKNALVNDTLRVCLEYDLKFQNSESKNDKQEIVEEYYNQLVKYGLNQSAFNLIYNNQITGDLGARELIKVDIKTDDTVYMIDGKQLYLNKNKPMWIE